MNKKVLTLSAVMSCMLFGAAANAADRIGVTIYKYDDNFMSVVRKAIEKDAKASPDVQLLMNDSQNDQSKQNDQIDVLLAKGVKALAIRADRVNTFLFMVSPVLLCRVVRVKIVGGHG